MAKLLKLRRGTTSQHSSFTGAEGEVTVDTDKETLVVHDGSTAGGHPVAAQDMANVPAGTILGTQLENSGVTAGQYGSSSAIPIVTVDAQGLVTGASTTAIDSTQIANGTSNVAVANNGNISVTRSGTERLLVTNTSVDVTGNLTLPDNTSGNASIQLGNSQDFFMNHNGTDSFIINNTGDLYLRDLNGDVHIQAKDAEESIVAKADGAVDIYHNNSKKFETTSVGVTVSGNTTSTGSITSTSNSTYPLNINGSDNGKIVLQGSSEPFIRFREGTTDKGYLQWNANGYFQLVNQETGDYLKVGNSSDGLEWVHDGTTSKVFHAGNDGAGSGLDADTLDGVNGANYVRTDQNTTINADLFAGGGSGAITVNGGSDLRFSNGDWTGNVNGTAKIQLHDNYLYISGGTSGIILRENNANRWIMDGSGHFIPGSNSTYNIGSNGVRVSHGYFDAITSGNGSAISALNASNLSSGTVAAARLDTASTQSAGNNSTKIATTAFVTTAIANAQAFPSGTKMLFQQTSAPTGWTKVTSGVNGRALRVTSGTAGSGGNVGFTSAFADRSLSANAGNATQGGNISVSVGNATQGGNVNISSVSTSGNVNSHTLTTSEIPSHSHSYSSGNPNARFITGGGSDISKGSSGKSTGNTGGGGGHSHGFTGSSHNHNASFSGSAHNHNANASFSGSAHNHSISINNLDMQVQYLDVIIASKD